MNKIAYCLALVAAASLASGCAAEAAAGAAGGADSAVAPKPEGSFTTSFKGQDYTVDYTGMKATVEMKHRLADSGPACVGYVKIALAGKDGVCKLDLLFEPTFGGGLVLKNAEFHAKATLYQDKIPIDAFQCPMFADMSEYKTGFKPAVFEYSSGDAFLGVKPLSQPVAGAEKGTVKGLELDPKGTIKMKMGGLDFTLDLTGIKVVGDVESSGDKALSCAMTYLPPSDIVLKDINPKSATFGQDVDLSSDFEGKFVTVHMGAGWCESCRTQVEHMQTIKQNLESQGREDFVMISINDTSASSPKDQKMALGNQQQATFPVLQAVSGKGWQNVFDCLNRKGKKNDGFIFAPDGQFIRKHEGKGTVYMNVWDQDVEAGLNAKVEDLDNCSCQDVMDAPKHVHHVACTP